MAGQSGFDQFAKKLQRLESEFSGEAGKRRLQAIAMQTKGDVEDAVRGTLGDLSMSRWRRGSPIDIKARFDIKDDHSFEMMPVGKAAGPMRVLESGRQAHTAGGKRRKGSYTSKKTGVTKDRFSTVKRNVGATRGKGTWSDAVGLMEKRVPARVEKALVKDMGKIFGRG